MGYEAFLNFLPKMPNFAQAGLDFGLYRKMRNDYASQVRHLRRREYQDMVFSMKAAGLNPILAAGATPGHSSAYSVGIQTSADSAGIGDSFARNVQAKAAADQVGPANSAKDAAAKLSQAETAATEESVNTQRRQQEAYEADVAMKQAQADLYRTQKINEETVKRAAIQQDIAHSGADVRRINQDIKRSEAETPPIYGDVLKNPVGSGMTATRLLNEFLGGLWTSGKELYNTQKKTEGINKEIHQKAKELEFLRKAKGAK